MTNERDTVQAQEVLDRGDAVNLARNMLGRYNCRGITQYGVRVLCEAIMSMDAALRARHAAAELVAAQPQEPVGYLKPDGRTYIPKEDIADGFVVLREGFRPVYAAPAQPAQPPADGWVCVPATPTEAMLSAMAECDGYLPGDRDRPGLVRWEDYWRMALAAAPQPPAREPLSDERIAELWFGGREPGHDVAPAYAVNFARAVLAAAGITGGKT